MSLLELTQAMHVRPSGAQIETFVNDKMQRIDKAAEDLRKEQHQFNEAAKSSAASTKSELGKIARSIVSMQRELCTRSCIVKGVPSVRSPKKISKGQGRKSRWVNKELPFETLAHFKAKVLPALGLKPEEVAIVSAVRFMQNPDRDVPPGIRVRFQTPDDRHMIFSRLGKFKGQAGCKGWHITSDFPEYLQDEYKKCEFVGAEYRARHPEHNTEPFLQGMEVRLRYRSREDRTDQWHLLPREEQRAIEKDIEEGKGIIAERKGKAKGLPPRAEKDALETAGNITLASPPKSPTEPLADRLLKLSATPGGSGLVNWRNQQRKSSEEGDME